MKIARWLLGSAVPSHLSKLSSLNLVGKVSAKISSKRCEAPFKLKSPLIPFRGWPTAPDGPYAWGYCFVRERSPPSDYCSPSSTYPCAPGKKYYGRAPIQLSWNYNYGQCGNAIGVGLLNNPDLAATDPVISFKTAIWFWMTPQSPKPSCHNVIIGKWSPTPADSAAGRVPGYGVITNIINGGIECGKGPNDQVKDRIGFYKRYCDILGVSYGSNLDCHNQRPFGNGLLNLVNSM
ncbi:endochitinase 1 [Manihot esculenta]|nr:endochitinase 1 [Manihot esculenta]